MANIVFIATSLDGYIADKSGGVEWLHAAQTAQGCDMGFESHFDRIDALIMGRNTFEMVLSFGVKWPYSKPVFLLTDTLTHVPDGYQDKVSIVNGNLKDIIRSLNLQGFQNLYIDGGKTIQSFLAQDLIDEMFISRIPILLGGGAPLFGDLEQPLRFKLNASQTYLDAVVQNHYIRCREE